MVRQPGDRLKGIPLENDDDDDQHGVVLMMMTLMMIMLLMTMNTYIYVHICTYERPLRNL